MTVLSGRVFGGYLGLDEVMYNRIRLSIRRELLSLSIYAEERLCKDRGQGGWQREGGSSL